MDKRIAETILKRTEVLANDLKGDVKRLTDYFPRFRLRVGDYRVLFEVVENTIEIHRIRHRSDLY